MKYKLWVMGYGLWVLRNDFKILAVFLKMKKATKIGGLKILFLMFLIYAGPGLCSSQK